MMPFPLVPSWFCHLRLWVEIRSLRLHLTGSSLPRLIRHHILFSTPFHDILNILSIAGLNSLPHQCTLQVNSAESTVHNQPIPRQVTFLTLFQTCNLKHGTTCPNMPSHILPLPRLSINIYRYDLKAATTQHIHLSMALLSRLS